MSHVKASTCSRRCPRRCRLSLQPGPVLHPVPCVQCLLRTPPKLLSSSQTQLLHKLDSLCSHQTFRGAPCKEPLFMTGPPTRKTGQPWLLCLPHPQLVPSTGPVTPTVWVPLKPTRSSSFPPHLMPGFLYCCLLVTLPESTLGPECSFCNCGILPAFLCKALLPMHCL